MTTHGAFVSAAVPLRLGAVSDSSRIRPPRRLQPQPPGSPSRVPPCVPARRSRSLRRPVVVVAVVTPAAVAAPLLELAEVSPVNYASLSITAVVFFLTFWGSISFVKGSTKPRITQASFTIPTGPSAVAKTVTKYLSGRGFGVDPDADPRPGVVTFSGKVKASSSVSALLVLVGASGLWAASLILNVLLPEALQSPNWGWISVLSLAVVPWYRGQAERVEEVLVLVEEDEPDAQSTLYVKGHRDEIIALETALGWVRNDPDAPIRAASGMDATAVPSK